MQDCAQSSSFSKELRLIKRGKLCLVTSYRHNTSIVIVGTNRDGGTSMFNVLNTTFLFSKWLLPVVLSTGRTYKEAEEFGRVLDTKF